MIKGAVTRNRPVLAVATATGSCLWSLALLPYAFFAPAYAGESRLEGDTLHTSATLVGVNGTAVVAVIAVPAVLSLLAWAGLHCRCARGSAAGTGVAYGAAIALAAFSVLGAASIGPLVLPAAVLLAIAVRATPRAR
jgi:hypothetical protein